MFLGTIVWVALGGPARRKERQGNAGRRGGRKARDKSFWGAPARDRGYSPGLLILVLVVAQLAKVTLSAADADEQTVQGTVVLGFVVAIGFRYRPDLVSAGMSLVGTVSLFVSRFGPTTCGSAVTEAQNVVWATASVAAMVVVLGLRLFIPRIPLVQRRALPAGGFWTSPGQPRRVGALGQTALTLFGIFELLDLVIRPMTTVPSWLAGPAIIGIAVGSAAVLVMGLAVLPMFTLSIVGAGATIGSFTLQIDEPCPGLGPLFVAALPFVAITFLARRFA